MLNFDVECKLLFASAIPEREREQFAPKTLLSFQIEDAVEDTFLAPTFVLGHFDIFISILCTEKKDLVFE